MNWLKTDLADHPGVCTLAYWHHPLFSSEVYNGYSSAGVQPLWDALYAARADVVLNGHAHNYERFVPQDPSGNQRAGGISEFVADTGGDDHLDVSPRPNSAKLDTTHFGALFLTLHAGSYDWQFKSTDGVVRDQSPASATCNRNATSTSVTAAPYPASPEQPITLTAKVTGTSTAFPTGTVDFTFDGNYAGRATLDGGQASISVPAQTPGSHQFQASYVGSQTVLRSTSPPETEQVTPPAPAPPAPTPAPAPADTTPPTIALSTPVDGAHYPLGASVNAGYSCQDGSGVASCTGTVPQGHTIDTGSLGTKAFTVTATDTAHNQASKTVHYTVDVDPGPAQVKASVGAALRAATKALERLHLRTLVRVSSFRFSFNASAPGTAIFTATARIKGKTITVASGQLAFSGPGKRTATQGISRAAARALRGLRSASVFERIKFTPARGNPFVGRKRVTLRR